MDYGKNTVYVVGHARTNTDNAITEQFKLFFICFVVDAETDLVVDVECSSLLGITNRFIQHIFMGQNFSHVSSDIELEVSTRYFGSSQKAILVAYKEAVKKYCKVKPDLIKRRGCPGQ